MHVIAVFRVVRQRLARVNMVMVMVLLKDRLCLSLKFGLIWPTDDIRWDTQMLFQNMSQHRPWAKRFSRGIGMIVLLVMSSLGALRVVLMEHVMRR